MDTVDAIGVGRPPGAPRPSGRDLCVEIANALIGASGVELGRRIARGVEEVGTMLGADYCVLAEYGRDGSQVAVTASLGTPAALTECGSGLSWTQARLAAGMPVVIREPADLPIVAKAERTMLREAGVTGAAVVPLGGPALRGTLSLFYRAGPVPSAADLVDLRVAGFMLVEASSRRRADAEAAAAEARARAFVEHLEDVVALVRSRDGVIVDVNPAVERIFGIPRLELLGEPITTPRLAPCDPETLEPLAGERRASALVMTGQESSITQVFAHRRTDGRWAWARQVVEPVDVGGEAHVVITVTDMTAQREAARLRERSALHDPLTGIPTRRLLELRLAGLAEAAEDANASIAVIHLDLDGLRLVVDRLGHERADELVATVVRDVSRALPAGGVVARLSGDELGVVAAVADEQAGRALLHSVLAVAARPVPDRDGAVAINAYGGAAFGTAAEATAGALFRWASSACRASRQRDDRTGTVWDRGAGPDLLSAGSLEDQLAQALDRRAFELHYQPVIRLSDRVVIGAEALLRWRHADHGLLRPAAFLDLAEASGLIVPIGEWALEEACTSFAAAHPALTVAVNMSVRQLGHGLAGYVRGLLNRSSIDPSLLHLELTESSTASSTEHLVSDLNTIRALGARVGLDDFGTGYSPLTYLQDLRLDFLKIDRVFVKESADRASRGSAIVDAVLALAHQLDLATVAEGVEDEACATSLQERGADLVQGYLFGRPTPLDEFSALIETERRRFATIVRRRRRDTAAAPPAPSAPSVPAPGARVGTRAEAAGVADTGGDASGGSSRAGTAAGTAGANRHLGADHGATDHLAAGPEAPGRADGPPPPVPPGPDAVAPGAVAPGAGPRPDPVPAPHQPRVVAPKLMPPAARSVELRRHHLLDRLAACHEPIVVVSAPAGNGKSTLVAQWARESKGPVAWLSLDPEDGDVQRFWLHLATAIQRADPSADGRTVAALGGRPDVLNVVVPLVIEQLAASPMRIVLDDYHLVRSAAIDDSVAMLGDHLPAGCQLVIATRHDPQLPISRWRGRGVLAELGEADLRLGPAEAEVFLTGSMGLSLAAEDIQTLTDRTEGWIGCLYLAARAIDRAADAHQFVQAFRGSQRSVLGYLMDEVLTGLSPDVMHLLRGLSVLERFTPGLADAITHQSGSAARLRELEQTNLLLIPLDDGGEWYRLHHLLRDALRFELRNAEPQRELAVHTAAAEWFSGAGYFEEAILHAEASGDRELARDMLRRHWLALMLSAHSAFVMDRIDRFDAGDLADPELAFAATYRAVESRQPERARELLGVVESAGARVPFKIGLPSGVAASALLRATYAFEGISVASAAARRLPDLFQPTAPLWRAFVGVATGMERWNAGDDGCVEVLERATRETDIALLNARTVGWLANLLLDLDDGERGAAATVRARALLGSMNLRVDRRASLVLLAEARLADRSEPADEGATARLLAEALAVSRLDFRYEARLYLLGRALPILERLGEKAATAVAVQDAVALLARHPDSGRAGTIARQAVDHLDPVVVGGLSVEPLSDRERRVLRLLVATGLSQPEMASELGVSHNTMKTHVKAVYRKLGVQSREEARARAAELGLG